MEEALIHILIAPPFSILLTRLIPNLFLKDLIYVMSGLDINVEAAYIAQQRFCENSPTMELGPLTVTLLDPHLIQQNFISFKFSVNFISF